MKFLAGLVLGLLLAVAIPLAFLAIGSYDVGATAAPGGLEQRLMPWALERSVATRAPAAKSPIAEGDAGALAKGLDLYREMCVLCHGAPGVEIGEAGHGLNPVPPPLDAPAVQRWTDGQLFWIVKNGVRMTGMPAWGPTHGDDKIWQLVAFVRRLPRLTDAERAQLREAQEEHEHGEAHESGADEEHAPAHEHPSAPHEHGTAPKAQATPPHEHR